MTNDKNDLLSGRIELFVDPIDEALEEVALLASAWQRNRDRNRPSPMLRRALIEAATDLVDHVKFHNSLSEAKAR